GEGTDRGGALRERVAGHGEDVGRGLVRRGRHAAALPGPTSEDRRTAAHYRRAKTDGAGPGAGRPARLPDARAGSERRAAGATDAGRAEGDGGSAARNGETRPVLVGSADAGRQATGNRGCGGRRRRSRIRTVTRSTT